MCCILILPFFAFVMCYKPWPIRDFALLECFDHGKNQPLFFKDKSMLLSSLLT